MVIWLKYLIGRFALLDNNDLDKMDMNNVVKNRICIGIAEFYVHFFIYLHLLLR